MELKGSIRSLFKVSLSVSDDSFSLTNEFIFEVDSFDEGVVSFFDLSEGSIFVSQSLFGGSQVSSSEGQSFFGLLDFSFQ